MYVASVGSAGGSLGTPSEDDQPDQQDENQERDDGVLGYGVWEKQLAVFLLLLVPFEVFLLFGIIHGNRCSYSLRSGGAVIPILMTRYIWTPMRLNKASGIHQTCSP